MERVRGLLRRAWWGPGLIPGLGLIFLLSYLLTGTTTVFPTFEDLAEIRPYRRMVLQAWGDGYFPLWSAGLLSGFPLGGWAHASGFYPLGVMLGGWDFAQAAVISSSLHLVIFGLGMYAMLRALALPRGPALLGATVVTFGPVMNYWQLNFAPTIATTAWSPWLFASAFLLLDRRRLLYLLMLAASFALQVAGGRYDFIVRELALMGILALGLALHRRERLAGIGLWLAGGLAGALATAGPALMHYEYFARSVRAMPLSDKYWAGSRPDPGSLAIFFLWATCPTLITALLGLRRGRRGIAAAAVGAALLCLLWVWAPPWWSFINRHLPVLKGLVWSNVMTCLAFMCLGVLAAEGIYAWSDSRRARALTAAVWAPALVLSAAYFAFWWWSGDAVPGVNENSRYAASLLHGRLLTAAMLIAAAAGWMGWRRRRRGPGKDEGRPWAREVAGTFMLLGLVDLAGTGFTALVHNPIPRFPAAPEAGARRREDGYLPYRSVDLYHFGDWYDLKIPAQAGGEPATRGFDGFISLPVRRYAEFLTLLAPEVMKVEDGRLVNERFTSMFKEDGFVSPTSMALMNFLNVGYFVTDRANIKFGPVYRFRFEPEREFKFTGRWQGPPGAASWEADGAAAFTAKAAILPGTRFQGRISLNVPALAGLQLLGREDNADRARLWYARTLSASGPGQAELDLDVPMPVAAAGAVEIRAAVGPLGGGARTQWRDPVLVTESQPLRMFHSEGDVSVLLNPAALPAMFPVHEMKVIPEAETRLAYIRAHPERLAREAVLEAPLNLPVGNAQVKGEGIRVLVYEDQKLVFEPALAQPGLVVLSESYYPGWQAETDRGLPLRILAADHAFRAVWLPEGRERVTMTYRPKSFEIGLWTSAVSLLMGLIAAGRMATGRRRVGTSD